VSRRSFIGSRLRDNAFVSFLTLDQDSKLRNLTVSFSCTLMIYICSKYVVMRICRHECLGKHPCHISQRRTIPDKYAFTTYESSFLAHVSQISLMYRTHHLNRPSLCLQLGHNPPNNPFVQRSLQPLSDLFVPQSPSPLPSKRPNRSLPNCFAHTEHLSNTIHHVSRHKLFTRLRPPSKFLLRQLIRRCSSIDFTSEEAEQGGVLCSSPPWLG
jgi:hypothetical protein